MANSEGAGRQPQFTNTQYEIPSWQTPWSKPWYQRTDSEKGDTPSRYKYNDRGHLSDCTCVNCEEDLEKAFSPNVDTTRQSVSDIPRDRHKDVNIQVHLEDLDITNGGEESSTSAQVTAPKKVFLLSDLAEVTPASSNNSITTTETFSTSNDRASSQDSTPTMTASMTHDSIMEVFGNFGAIEAISQQTQDIQTRVHNFSGTSNTQEYKTMRDLLLALMRELSRIHSNVEWFAISKNMALEAIKNTLVILEQKAKQEEQS
ncbi:uncharacterized protein LOC110251797 [Exaiptasia diaphana]|uniref:Uncharacterized protein n=1 Tax=Exaiptasia diaphana TaxID=2652724 RepID=A0A913Y4Y6_EXADI|nr:uncharacterized protein LOC110251797 [Exaiptasia diaphana]KXJ22828.1 hypothetical protein AC249_AIPGENE26085 [Exaiptasia diaphana]